MLWDVEVRYVIFALNTSVVQTTGFTPFFLMYGRHPVQVVELEYPVHRTAI